MKRLAGMGSFRHYTIFTFLSLSGCSLAPTYTVPDTNLPATYKEAGKWSSHALIKKDFESSMWWKIYEDETLNTLENKLASANQNLKAGIARYEQAKALSSEARAGFYPIIAGLGNKQREQHSATIANPAGNTRYNDVSVGATLSYEFDLWGRVRNTVLAAESNEQASLADVAALKLLLQAELANTYFSLRADDEAQRILDKTAKAYKKALYLVKMRYQDGADSALSLAEAEAQYETAKTLAADMRLNRAQSEHAMAILLGEAPANFSLPVDSTKIKVISLAPTLPSTLLQRRPDIAAAEARVRAANANIGVARAAYFPDFNLQGSVGYEAQNFSNLIQAPSLFWALGPAATLALFQGGAINAAVDFSQASYQEAVANYRQTVLTALGEVEDNLVALHRLDEERQSQSAAMQAAKRALRQANYQYQGGISTYLDVVVIQDKALQAELADVALRNRRQLASVGLIKAMGGGF